MSLTQFLVPWVCGLNLVLLALVLHKVRRIHLMMFKVAEDARLAHFESGSVYRQIESLGALQQLLGLRDPLPPLRGWAASPDFLLALAKHVLSEQPKVAFECSSGSSTLVLARCLQLLGKDGHVYSLEHDASYATATRELLARHGVSAYATVLDAPLERMQALQDHATPWYSTRQQADWPRQIELVVIDGPPGGRTGSRSRFPALAALHDRLAPDCSIFLDDADRPDERWAVEQWMKMYPEFRSSDLGCEKGCVRLSRAV
jgi:predicted O-methyltransferase YrrM